MVFACLLSIASIQSNIGRTANSASGFLPRPATCEMDKFIAPPTNACVPSLLPAVNVTSEQVNTSLFYTTEPAPMGIADYGINPNTNKSYSYTTNSFLGSVVINSFSTQGGSYSGWASIQLNVVLKFNAGSATYIYWLQDVAQIDTQHYNQISFLDNVWNLSSASASMSSSGISGGGSIDTYGSTTFYYDQSSSEYQQSYPNTINLEINSTEVNLHPTVTFAYNTETGWMTFDTVTFTPIVLPIQDWNLVVNGSQYTPNGLFYDAELIAGGAGGGASTNDMSSNIDFALDYYNGNNMQFIPFFYSFGSDTAETISNANDVMNHYPSGGAFYAQLTQGTGVVGNYSITPAIGIFSIPDANGGTLYVGNSPDSACSFTGNVAQVTIYPGTYTVSIGNWKNSYTFSCGNNSVITLPAIPGAPLSLSTSLTSESTILTWSAPANDGGATVASYKIYRGTTAGGEKYLCTVYCTSYVDNNTIPGTFYYYTITAVNCVGEGPQSSTSFAYVPLVAPNFDIWEGLGIITWIAVSLCVIAVLLLQRKKRKTPKSTMIGVQDSLLILMDKIDPKNADAWNNLGNALDEKRDIDGAVTAYRKVVELDPKNADAWNHLGNALDKRGDIDGTIDAYHKAIEIAPKDADAWNHLGFTLGIKGDIDGAVTAYRKAVELDPKNANAWNNLGNVLDEKSNIDGAIDAYYKAIEIDLKNANIWSNLGLALEDNGDLDGAVTAYRRAVELDPEDEDARNNLISASNKRGKRL